ncbi:minor tail protein [Mycobacterium phage BoostSeason]|uniref:Minor tail protein n=1 Tax=Mycobacterium phage Mufasa TaxID=1718600 RepID=A0A0M5M301_9CAUD|nr:minor tail protein [Mycobacterium phage Mufasa]ALF00458.1 minor tail protein [Mycobacterium phage Mufasa]AYN57197.1 minor tail protein [Mycobacterium phage BoostSeason]
MAEIDNTPEVVAAITQHLGEDMSAEQVANVLAAWNNVRGGDPVGMVRRDEDTGKIAHRVNAHGVQQWRVSAPDGEQYNDLQPTLPWPVLFDPS